MNKLLNDYRDSWLEQLLSTLWSQWDAIGVQGSVAPAENAIIDPEALILLTASLGRYDARLFDEALDWMQSHERLINMARLNALLMKEPYSGGNVLSAVAHFLSAPRSAAKWKRMAGPRPKKDEPLFFDKQGLALPVVRGPDPFFAHAGLIRDKVVLRHMVQKFDPERPVNLLLKMRALFGVNSRAEVIAYLASHPFSGAAEAATQTGYLRRTVHNTLVEMNLSGSLDTRVQAGENLYQLAEKTWRPLLGRTAVHWRNWGAFFGVVDHIWHKLNTPAWADANSLTLASELTLLVNDAVKRLDRAGISRGIRRRALDGDPKEHIRKCFVDLSRILDFAVE